jgi:hypothetical protein
MHELRSAALSGWTNSIAVSASSFRPSPRGQTRPEAAAMSPITLSEEGPRTAPQTDCLPPPEAPKRFRNPVPRPFRNPAPLRNRNRARNLARNHGLKCVGIRNGRIALAPMQSIWQKSNAGLVFMREGDEGRHGHGKAVYKAIRRRRQSCQAKTPYVREGVPTSKLQSWRATTERCGLGTYSIRTQVHPSGNPGGKRTQVTRPERAAPVRPRQLRCRRRPSA